MASQLAHWPIGANPLAFAVTNSARSIAFIRASPTVSTRLAARSTDGVNIGGDMVPAQMWPHPLPPHMSHVGMVAIGARYRLLPNVTPRRAKNVTL